MKASDAFPSKYISAGDLQDRDHVVKIAHVVPEDIDGKGKQKYVCYFAGKKKGLALNKTNWNTIARITGMEDSDDWTGCEICLFPTMVDFQGDVVPAVRIKAVPKSRNGGAITTAPQRMAQEPLPNDRPQIDPDDEIPF